MLYQKNCNHQYRHRQEEYATVLNSLFMQLRRLVTNNILKTRVDSHPTRFEHYEVKSFIQRKPYTIPGKNYSFPTFSRVSSLLLFIFDYYMTQIYWQRNNSLLSKCVTPGSVNLPR